MLGTFFLIRVLVLNEVKPLFTRDSTSAWWYRDRCRSVTCNGRMWWRRGAVSKWFAWIRIGAEDCRRRARTRIEWSAIITPLAQLLPLKFATQNTPLWETMGWLLGRSVARLLGGWEHVHTTCNNTSTNSSRSFRC